MRADDIALGEALARSGRFSSATATEQWPEEPTEPHRVTVDGEHQGDHGGDHGDDPGYEYRVGEQLRLLRIRREAQRRLNAEELPAIPPPPVKPLSQLLSEPAIATQYRIAGVAPHDARILLAAPAKAGKTHLVGNLIRSLVDGDPFLGKFKVNTTATGLVVIDNEMSENTLREWLRDQQIVNTAAVADVISLRGRVSAFNILDPKIRREWSARLRDVGCDYLILDCLRPVLDALGIDESREAGRFLVPFDEMLNEAGVSDALVVHHMGHSNERSRGDSRLQDWPDVPWRINRDKGRDGTDDPNADRYFTAYGRDVNVTEGKLTLDPVNRRLTFSGGSRADARINLARTRIVDCLLDAGKRGEKPNTTELEAATVGADVPQKAFREARDALVRSGVVRTDPGPNRSKLYVFAYPCAACGLPVTSGKANHESCPESADELTFT